jgi:hypothetical protein
MIYIYENQSVNILTTTFLDSQDVLLDEINIILNTCGEYLS